MSQETSKPGQTQESQPGDQYQMEPQPKSEPSSGTYKKLAGKVALITGGDSGIGRAVAIAFAEQGADMVIAYLEEDKDAEETRSMVEKHGQKAVVIKGDVSQSRHCQEIVDKAIASFGKLDIVVNNAAQQYPQDNLEDITEEQLTKTFSTNIYSYFFITKAALAHLKKGASIINTSSVTAYRGSHHLLDYAATKGAIVSFTRSLSANLAPKGIRVNGVAPGPIWTPLIPATFSKEHVDEFGTNVPLGRPGEPAEVAPSYVFLASEDSSYMTGQFLHPNGGEIINT
ncbi:SDR family oxidoreductase [Anditalea andensis]|uniref:Short-chain dehydrogenase n=1 Tax=Anditalea andensis TaxID=1048983 RepID=A0A074L6D5_9BACT|nr:SDR family oxidoreductase [Anditalea andensis]KEO75398.1 short-chain dehydrogenase [Anditalea andensis]